MDFSICRPGANLARSKHSPSSVGMPFPRCSRNSATHRRRSQRSRIATRTRNGAQRPQRSINEPLAHVAIGVDAPVAQKRPVRALFLHAPEIDVHDARSPPRATPALARICPGGIAHKALAPELDARPAHGRLVPNAVDRRHVAAVGNRVAALDRFPAGMLPVAVLFLFAGMPADGRRDKRKFARR